MQTVHTVQTAAVSDERQSELEVVQTKPEINFEQFSEIKSILQTRKMQEKIV